MQETTIMYGAPVVDYMLNNWKKIPNAKLNILANSSDEAGKIYVKNKMKKCQEFQIKCEIFDIFQMQKQQVLDLLEDIFKDTNNSNFVILQKPIPKHLREFESEFDAIISSYPQADIDAFGGDLSSDFTTPATPLGVMKMLEYYVGKHALDGLNAVVIGRSKIVGEPMARLLTKANCTVTICHSHTKDLRFYTQHADIIISAVGKPKFIDETYIGENNPIVVDVGINRDENGKVCGDVDFQKVESLCSFISPVPKGVGVLTVASLIYKMGIPQKEKEQ